MKRKHLILFIIGGLLISVMVTFSIGIPLITNIGSIVREILPADMSKLVYMDENETFVDIGRGYSMFCAVSDKGNCYVNGMRAEKIQISDWRIISHSIMLHLRSGYRFTVMKMRYLLICFPIATEDVFLQRITMSICF